MNYSLARTKRMITTVFFATLITVSSAIAPVAGAQTADRESITMSPTSKKYKVDAGGVITDKLTIINDGTLAYDFLVYARPYSIVNNDYTSPNFTSSAKNADLYGWVQFPKTKFHLEAGASVDVQYSIHVPTGVAPGGHYGVLFAETQPVAGASSGNAVIRKKRVGSIMYATVNGTYRNSGDALGSSIPFWQVQPPLSGSLSVKNTGNTDFADTVHMTVTDLFGGVKYDATKEYQVLPDTSRTIPVLWEQAPWFGLYKVSLEQKFLDKSSKAEGYVLMMPRYVPIAIIVILIIGGIYAWARRRKK